MAAESPQVPQANITSVKLLAELPNHKLKVPSYYVHPNSRSHFPAFNLDDDDDDEDSIPILDLSLLSSEDPDQRFKAIQDIGRACEDWGFFMLMNHGMPESLMKGVIDVANEFFEMPEEEKLVYKGQQVFDPIKYGTSFNTSKESIYHWRDYLKIFVHPDFHYPDKPNNFRDLLWEYCEKSRKVARILLSGISESLGLEEELMKRSLDLDSGFQLFVANYYPACPQPELVMGLPPHSDFGLLTFLIQNDVGGLQIQHKGKWININPIPNSILVNTGDHLEIFTNGKYKSVLHRAVVKNKVPRISIGIANCPAMNATVSPAASPLIQNEIFPPLYLPTKYSQYVEMQQTNPLDGKSCLDRIKIGHMEHPDP